MNGFGVLVCRVLGTAETDRAHAARGYTRESTTMIESTGTETDEPKAKWWIWMPLGAAVAFGGFGLAIYDYEMHARNAREICAAMAASGAECDKPDTEYGKALSRYILDRLSNSSLLTAP